MQKLSATNLFLNSSSFILNISLLLLDKTFFSRSISKKIHVLLIDLLKIVQMEGKEKMSKLNNNLKTSLCLTLINSFPIWIYIYISELFRFNVIKIIFKVEITFLYLINPCPNSLKIWCIYDMLLNLFSNILFVLYMKYIVPKIRKTVIQL